MKFNFGKIASLVYLMIDKIYVKRIKNILNTMKYLSDLIIMNDEKYPISIYEVIDILQVFVS